MVAPFHASGSWTAAPGSFKDGDLTCGSRTAVPRACVEGNRVSQDSSSERVRGVGSETGSGDFEHFQHFLSESYL
jgi:hypothetical protein